MPSPYFNFLTIDFQICDVEFMCSQLDNFDRSKNKHWNHLKNFISKDIEIFLHKFDIEVLDVELFYTPPHGFLPWHTDMNPPEDFVKINYVWGSLHHLMCYGEIISKDQIFNTSKTEVGSQYIGLQEKDVYNVTAVKINKPTIINAGRPHKILNFDSTSRWCLSLIITKNHRRILFEDALDIFNEYVEDYR